MTANPTRLCKGCGEVKDFVRGTWLWSAKHGASGRLCSACVSKKSSEKELARRAVDPEFKAKRNEAMRDNCRKRYAEQLGYKELRLKSSIKWQLAKRDADPGYRAAKNAATNSYQIRKRKEDLTWRAARNKAALEWQRANAHKVNAYTKARKASKKSRTPKWLTKDDYWMMEQAYELAQLRNKATGVRWHVDHIVPLQGANVSGLHVPSNLRVITASENLAKGAKWATA